MTPRPPAPLLLFSLLLACDAQHTVGLQRPLPDADFPLGSLFAEHDVPLAYDTGAAVLADVNGDGRPDLAVADTHRGTATVLLGNGRGAFRSQGSFAGQGSYPYLSGLAVGDIDGDFVPDLVFADVPGSLLHGDGTGRFHVDATYDGGSPTFVVLRDLDGDRRLDLLAVGGGGVRVLRGAGLTRKEDYQFPFVPYRLAAEDLDGDGYPDLVVSSASDAGVSVRPNRRDGTFGAGTLYRVSGVGPHALAVGDLDLDGRPDLVVASENSNTLSVLLNLGGGPLRFGAETVLGTGTTPIAVAVADLDRDGLPDLLVVNENSDSASVYPGRGDGTFRGRQSYRSGRRPSSLAVGDVNCDGLPDFLLTNANSESASLFVNLSGRGWDSACP